MALVDSIIGAESGESSHMPLKFVAYTLIGELLLSSGPAAILRRIIQITIDAVNRMRFRRLFSHVRKKILKIFFPSFAYLNATRSVEFIGNMPFVGASIDHATPSIIFRSCLSTAQNGYRFSVSGIRQPSRFNLPTATTNCVPRAKIRHGYIDGLSAIALTKVSTDFRPAIFSYFWLSFANRDESPKSLTCAIYTGCH